MQISFISICCWFVIISLKKQSADWKQKFILISLLGCLLVPVLKFLPVSISTKADEIGSGAPVSESQINIQPYWINDRSSEVKGYEKNLKAADKGLSGPVKKYENINWFWIIWVSGSCIFLFRLFYQLISIANEKNKAFYFKSYKKLRIYVSEKIEVPILYSLGKPLIIIPAEMIHWQNTELNQVLDHELCHYQRKDHWQLWLTSIILIIYWFHPFIRVLIKKHRAYTELACDRDMLLAGADPADYAQALISCVTVKSNTPVLASMSTQPKLIEQRLDSLLEFNNFKLSNFQWLIIIVLVSMMIAGSISWNPEKWVTSDYFISEIEYDLPSIRNNNPPPGEMHLSVLYDGVENESVYIKMKLSNQSESSWVKLGPLKKFNNYIHTWHISLKNNARFTGEYEIVGAENDGVIDGVGVGMIGTDFDGRFRILKSKSETNGKIPNIICSWPLGLFDEEFIAVLPQLKTDNPDSVKRLLCGAQLVGNGVHQLN